MRLADMMARRQTICAGLLVTLTERCPLHCAHCSFASTATGRQLDAAALLAFVGTFTPDCRPDVLLLTGGEPLLRPRLVAEVAAAARAAGTATAVLSGAFFARGGELPAAIRRVAGSVDHLSLSLDVFHEREVARADVFAVLHDLLRLGVATSLHVVGTGPDDPYVAGLTEEVVATFGDDVPLLVGGISPIGRATAWAARPAAVDGGPVLPCDMAAWPVVTVDGTVTACCHQSVVDGPDRPDHLRLGHVGSSTWPAVYERARELPLLRMIRTVGPLHIAERAGGAGDGDYCGTCRRLGDMPGAVEWATRAGGGVAGKLLQEAAIRWGTAGGPAALLRRHGGGRYADLVGTPGEPPAAVRPESTAESGGVPV